MFPTATGNTWAILNLPDAEHGFSVRTRYLFRFFLYIPQACAGSGSRRSRIILRDNKCAFNRTTKEAVQKYGQTIFYIQMCLEFLGSLSNIAKFFLWLVAHDPPVNITLNANTGEYTGKPTYDPVENILECCID